MEFKHVNFKAPTKRYKKDKEQGDIQVVARIVFEAVGADDETLMAITALADSGHPVAVTITAGQFHLGPKG